MRIMVKQIYRSKLWGLLCILMMTTTFATNANAVRFPEFPFHKDMNVQLAAKDVVNNGLTTRAYQFYTKRKIDEVVQFYQDEWDDINEVDFGDWKILSHREDDFLFTVQIELKHPKRTHGTLAITPVFAMLEKSESQLYKQKKSIGKGFPALSNTTFVNDIIAEESNGRSRTLVFSNSHSIKRNLEYYRSQMRAKGWVSIFKSIPKAQKSKQSALVMNKNGQKLNISLSRKNGSTYGVAVFLP